MSLTAPIVLDTDTPTTPTATMVIPVLVGAVTGTGSPVATQVTGDALRDFFQGGTSDAFISTVAIATPSAYTVTTFSGFASTVDGAVVMGFGTTWDVGLKQRSGTTVAGVLANTSNFGFISAVISTTALATPSAYAATTGAFFASTVSGATLMGFGTTGDVTLKNRAGTDVLIVNGNSSDVTATGAVVASTATSATPASTMRYIGSHDGGTTSLGFNVLTSGNYAFRVQGVSALTVAATAISVGIAGAAVDIQGRTTALTADVASGALGIYGNVGTGTGAVGGIVFKVPVTHGSDSVAQTLTTVLTLGATTVVTAVFAGSVRAPNIGINMAPTATSPLCITGLPTASAGLASGDIWANSNVLTIIP